MDLSPEVLRMIPAAINKQFLAGHCPTTVAGEEQHDFSDFLWSDQIRDALSAIDLALYGGSHELPELSFRHDPARGHRIDADPSRP